MIIWHNSTLNNKNVHRIKKNDGIELKFGPEVKLIVNFRKIVFVGRKPWKAANVQRIAKLIISNLNFDPCFGS